MTDLRCDYPGRDEALISSLYDDLDNPERKAFDAHLAGCGVCRTELAGLGEVRRQLEHWDAPLRQIGRPVPVRRGAAAARAGSARPAPKREQWWQQVPAWARAAAAILCIGTAAGAANLEVHRDSQGWTMRTGWMRPSPAASREASVESQSSVVSQASVLPPPGAAPWHADLAALERQLRSEIQTSVSSAAARTTAARPDEAVAQADTLRRVRSLVQESERRQERELALRVGQVLRDVSAQRQSDLRAINSNLGMIQSNTGAEVMRQRQLLSYLVRVSGQK
ncbi:MAG: hypothetical protein IT176_09955 [Acidobacteria bacterium]|nr:hypothetical protein [Acidobacteriota bacterium]